MKSMQFAEDLYKAVIDGIHRFIVAVNIAENDFQTIGIVTLIKEFLISLVVFYAAGNYLIKEFQCSSPFGVGTQWYCGQLPAPEKKLAHVRS
jgi:hypothetical protein